MGEPILTVEPSSVSPGPYPGRAGRAADREAGAWR
jgi:hypothetical protein